MEWLITLLILVVALPLLGWFLVVWVIGIQYIPNDKVGVVEKLWGGQIQEGKIIALGGEPGFQPEVLRGGIHFGYPRWRWTIHRLPLVSVPQGKMAYIYARDGDPLPAGQTLGRTMACDNFQNARAFLVGQQRTVVVEETIFEEVRGVRTPKQIKTTKEILQRGQRGRQRGILREGVYAVNFAVFVVIAEDRVYSVRSNREEDAQVANWQKALNAIRGFDPIVIGRDGADDIGIITVQDGPPLQTGEIIAPEVLGHNNFQDPETFIANGGQRGRQYPVLTDGTYFINHWFASVEPHDKTIIEIGEVGVVISYYGKEGGKDLSGVTFRHGERVAKGERGVWADPLGPGKYPFNTYAGVIVKVPTTNFVLHWITGKSESHHYDDNLRSIDLVTKDAYEPVLPLSLVVHIDYQKAPSVIQRFGEVKKLITQTIDPMLSAYFRDISHKASMLELLQQRDEIQHQARDTMKVKFEQFDIELVDVLIGKPEAGPNDGGKIEGLLEQLRTRQLSVEQVKTFEQQQAAAEKLKSLEEAKAVAAMQKELTNSAVKISITQNDAQAQLAKAEQQKKQTIVEAEAQLEQARRQAEQRVVLAEAEAKQVRIAAEAESQRQILIGKGEGTKTMQVGLAHAEALRREIAAYGHPRIYALVQVAQAMAQSAQPLVPERIFAQGGGGGGGAAGGADGDRTPGINPLQTLLSLLLANETAFGEVKSNEGAATQKATDELVNAALGVLSGKPTEGPKA